MKESVVSSVLYQEVKAQNQIFQEICDQVPDVIVILDRQLTICKWLGNAEASFGYAEEEIIGRHISMLFDRHSREAQTAYLQASFEGSPVLRGEFSCVNRNGLPLIIEMHIRAFASTIDANWQKIGIFRDITESKRREQLSQFQGDVLEMIAAGRPLNQILNATCLFAEEIVVSGLCSILILDEKDPTILRVGAGPNIPKPYLQALDGFGTGQCAASCGTAAFLGEPVIVSDISTDPYWEAYRELAEENDVRACWSTPFFGKNGRVLGTFAISFSYINSPIPFHLNLMKMAAYLVSIAIERKQEEAALIEAQKLESLGIMAGGIAHDFNNILVAISGQTAIALRKMADDHPAVAHLQKAAKAADHASKLTKQMLAYSGRSVFKMEPVDINQLILDSEGLLSLAVPKHINLILDLADKLPPVAGDVTQIQQVVLNLVLNATESILSPHGSVTVSTTIYTVPPHDKLFSRFINQPVQAGQYIRVDIEDTGCGMTNAEINQIFDPFYSTKETGRGLGLSAVLGIVKGHSGGIDVNSVKHKGSKLSLLFPIEPFPDESEDEVVMIENNLHAFCVLVIDDEMHVRETIEDILMLENMDVLLAKNGQEGVALFKAHQPEIDLILLDLSMPGMSGEETFRQIRQLDPEIKIVLSSGFSEIEVAHRFKDDTVALFIQKPYRVDEFIAQIQGVLKDA